MTRAKGSRQLKSRNSVVHQATLPSFKLARTVQVTSWTCAALRSLKVVTMILKFLEMRTTFRRPSKSQKLPNYTLVRTSFEEVFGSTDYK